MAGWLLGGMALGAMASGGRRRRQQEVIIVQQPPPVYYVPAAGTCVAATGPQPYPLPAPARAPPPMQMPAPAQAPPAAMPVAAPPPLTLQQPPHVRAARVPGGAMPAFSYTPSEADQKPECIGPDGRPMYRVLDNHPEHAPGSPRHEEPAAPPAAPEADPLSFTPAYAGQHPIGR
jgi:hypothetical protein